MRGNNVDIDIDFTDQHTHQFSFQQRRVATGDKPVIGGHIHQAGVDARKGSSKVKDVLYDPYWSGYRIIAVVWLPKEADRNTLPGLLKIRSINERPPSSRKALLRPPMRLFNPPESMIASAGGLHKKGLEPEVY